MINTTKIKIPKKYQNMLELVEKDEDGYWAYSEYGFHFPSMECHTAHEDTQADLMRVIRELEPCDCEQCKRELAEKAKQKQEI